MQHIKPTVVNPTCLFHLSSYPWQYDEREHKQKAFSTFRKLGICDCALRNADSRPEWWRLKRKKKERKSLALPWPLTSAHKPARLTDWAFPTDPSLSRITAGPEKQLCRQCCPLAGGLLAAVLFSPAWLHSPPSVIIVCLSGPGGCHFLLSVRLNSKLPPPSSLSLWKICTGRLKERQ